MSVRIRVYPQNGLGAGGLYGNAQTQVRLSQQALQNQRQMSNLQLNYERALWEEKLKFAQLQAQAQYGAFGGLGGIPIAAGMGLTGIGGAIPAGFGQVAGFGLNAGLGLNPLAARLPIVPGGSGQTNVTNQTSTGGNQSVSNTNNYQVSSSITNPYPPTGMFGGGWGWGGGGGFLSSLLGALI